MWPLNPQRQIHDLATGEFGDSIIIVSASSFHLGGANFAFVDGSVRFVKDSVQSWPVQPLGRDLFGEALPASVSWSFAVNGFGSFLDVICYIAQLRAITSESTKPCPLAIKARSSARIRTEPRGYLGQFLVVVPKLRIVTVRQRRNTGNQDPQDGTGEVNNLEMMVRDLVK